MEDLVIKHTQTAYQAAITVAALAVALCKQPGIDGDKLRVDLASLTDDLSTRDFDHNDFVLDLLGWMHEATKVKE